MHALRVLTIANIRSFVRDRSALFWTLAFPIVFVILFGTIFSGGGSATFNAGWVDEDGTAASQQLRAVFASTGLFDLRDGTLDQSLEDMHSGDIVTVIVVPAGYATAISTAAAVPTAAPPLPITVYTDPSRSTNAQAILQNVNSIVQAQNQALSGQPPILAVEAQTIQTQQLTGVSYFVPSILAMALMQLGIFAAIPLVQQREKLIFKRLNATPLPRWTLVGSNVLTRLLIAGVQTALIVGIGIGVLHVEIVGSLLLMGVFVIVGAVAFIGIGYVLASFARTEEAANGMTSVIQFPLMFLSGIFFPIELMPQWLRGVAVLLPLTYLGDALRQTMVGGAPFAPLPVDFAVLGAWLVGSLLISARFFRWQ